MGRALAAPLTVALIVGFWSVILSADEPLDLVRNAADQRVMPDVEARLLVAALVLLGVAHALLGRTRLGTAASGLLARLERPSDARFAGFLFLGSVLVLGLVRYGVLGGAPLTDDEWAYTFHARTLASGALWAPAPPDPVHFDYTFLRIDGARWYSTLQPGLAALMAPGVWLCDDPFLSLWPLHAALPPLTFWAAAGLIRGEPGPAPRLAGLLVMTSPWFLLTGATVEPYAAFAGVVAVVLGATARSLRITGDAGGAWRLGGALGASLGLGLLVRPFEAVVVGGVAGVAGAVSMAVGERAGLVGKLRIAAVAVLAAVPFVLAQLAYNRAMTGFPFTPPMGVSTLPGFWGFGGDMYKGHDVGDAVRIWGGNLLRAAVWMAGGTLLSLRSSWRRPASRWLLMSLVGFVLLFLPRPVAGVADFGPVYLFALLPVFAVILAEAAGPTGLATWAASLVVSYASFTPWVVFRASTIAKNGALPFRAAAAADGEVPRLVLVRRSVAGPSGWIFGIPIPRPDLGDATIFAWATPQDHRDEVRARIVAGMPGREVLMLDLSGPPP